MRTAKSSAALNKATERTKLDVMNATLQLERMSREEKLQAMEALWADLSKDDAAVPSPAWHHDVLRKTEARVAAGQEQMADWTTAKTELRKRFE